MTIVTQLVNIEAVIAARDHDVVAEGDIRIGKAQQGRAGTGCLVGFRFIAFRRFLLGFCRRLRDHVIRGVNMFLAMMMSVGRLLPGYCLICCRFDFSWQKAFGGQFSGVGGVIEPRRFAEHRHFAEIPYRLFGIVQTCREMSSRVIRETQQQTVHEFNFLGLVVGDIRCELKERWVIGGTRLFHERFDHIDSAFMVSDHQ